MRKMIGIFLCLALLSGCLLPVLAAEEAADLHIVDLDSFLKFAENCRLDSFSADLTVSLDADIDLSAAEFAGIPIFCGTFFGNGHKISGLELSTAGSQRGLFRYLTDTALVQDLTVEGKVIPAGDRTDVGGIAGRNAGIIRDCQFSGQVSGRSNIGGIAGYNTITGRIEDCKVSGSVAGKHLAGGVAGHTSGVIHNCENTAAVNTTAQQNSMDLSDITIENITGTENAAAVTDIGGIAGYSSGTLRDCVNRGAVGYRHMSYNVGGIAGRQTGYIVNCDNLGSICGRKEVGGIVGHMEPSVVLRYEADTLQLLKAQMAVLSGLVDRTVSNAKNQTALVQRLTAQLEGYVTAASGALDVLTLDPEDPRLEEPEVYLSALQQLADSLQGIDRTLRLLYQTVKDTADTLSQDLDAVSRQIEVINGVLDNAEDNLGGTIADVSDADTAEDLSAKVENCRNLGPVLGDINVGGIAGAMAPESDLDPEKDVTVSGDATLHFATSVRCVVLTSVNRGAVNAKRRNAGGIAGWQSMGLLKQCESSGAVSGGDYTGGIAGQSLGYIRSCHAKGEINGSQYAGGIAGSGAVVTDCYAMVTLKAQECYGAILGGREDNPAGEKEPVRHNLYTCIGSDPGAIDGISYDTLAQSVTLEQFLALEALPDMFTTVQVTFLQADGTAQVVPLTVGAALDPAQIPEVTPKTGYVGKWLDLEKADLQRVLYDLTFTAAYIANNSALQGGQTHGGKPEILVQGDFDIHASVTVSALTGRPALPEKHSLVQGWQVTVDSTGQITGLRCLLPQDVEPERAVFFLQDPDGKWEKVTHRIDGSYAVIETTRKDVCIIVARYNGWMIPWLWVGIGGGILLILAVMIPAAIHRKKKRSAIPEESQIDS